MEGSGDGNLEDCAAGKCGTGDTFVGDCSGRARGSTNESTVQVDEIVVSAQRRDENLQSVPIAVTALSGEALETKGAISTDMLQVAAPGLVSYQRSIAFVPYLRGVGSNQTGSGIESSVAVYLDGVYQGAKAGNILDLANIERVEVLKGPQGTLFGRNATGGAINIVTLAPSKDASLDVSAGYGRFSEKRARLYATASITDTFMASVSFNGRWDNGYIKNPTSGVTLNPTENVIAMAKVRWDPSDDVVVDLSGSFSKVDNPTWVSPHVRSGTLTSGQAAGGLAAYGGQESLISTNNPVQWTKANRATLTTTLGLSDAIELNSITGYVETKAQSFVDLDASTKDQVHLMIGQQSLQFSQEIQLRSRHDGPLKWIVGAYYFWLKDGYGGPGEDLLVQSGLPARIRPADLLVSGRSMTGVNAFGYSNAYSGFGQATYEIAPSTRVTAGLRYSWERKRAKGTRYTYTAVAGTGGGLMPYNGYLVNDGLIFSRTGPTTTMDVQKSWGDWSWRLAVDHNLNKNVMIYGTYSRGFKSGAYAVSSISATLQPVNPETLDAFELGIKSELFDRRLRLNVASFYYNYRDIQVSLVTGDGVSTYQNAGKGRLYGIDVDMTAAVSSRLTINGGLNLLNSKYTDFPNAQVYLPKVSGVTCQSTPRLISISEARDIAAGTPTGGNCNYKLNATGQSMIFAPKLTANIGFDYEFPLGSEARAVLASNLYHNSGFDVEAGGVNSHIGSYQMLSASLTMYFQSDRYSFQIWGTNLTNSKHDAGLSAFSQGTQVFTVRPVSFGVTLGAKFGG
jgi:iron complex outermembrane receptor protein